jgi:hypothetical protein
VLITSPETMPSPRSGRASSETSASPVLTPIRTSSARLGSASFSSAIASWIAIAARTARSASSSWATGAPNTPTTASPMNFSTVPPWRSSSWRSLAWNVPRIARTSSGSSRSARPVEPTRSANTTVTTLRSSRAPTARASSWPHALQKRAPAGFSWPHAAQALIRASLRGSRACTPGGVPGSAYAAPARSANFA